jgi:uncharacterized protein YbaP (TraB family)
MATDADSIVYLFGTIHVLDPKLSWHSKKVDSAFRSSSTLIMEAPAHDTPPSEVQATVMKYAQNPPGTGLSKLLGSEGNQLLLQTLGKLGMSEQQALQTKLSFEGLRPWFVGLQIAMMQMQRDGYDPNSGVEAILYNAAKRADMKMSYLETLDQQFAMLSGLGMEAEIKMLKETMRDIDLQDKMLSDMIQYWMNGMPDGVAQIIQASMTDPAVYKTLLTDRNQAWATMIRNLIVTDEGTSFIAVGAGHLAGKGSVQDFLKLQGIDVVRIQ